MPDFWRSCGYRLLRPGADGRLVLTDDFLRASLARPELAPMAQSCTAERVLHEKLVAAPRAPVAPAEIAGVADADTRANYAVWLRFRDRLAAAPSIEAAYATLFRDGVDVPPLLVAQLTQVLLRHVLGEGADPIHARAAEMLFRAQRIAVTPDGAVTAADAATIDRLATTGGFGHVGELLHANRTPPRTAEIDLLSADNALLYWDRDEQHDFAVRLNTGRPALDGLCRVLERWVAHFHGVGVSIAPAGGIEGPRWIWHVGLDAEATALLNDLYNRADVDEARKKRLLCLFRLEFADRAAVRPDVAGYPVWLAMAMDAGSELRLKPQNLLFNLPLARTQ